MVNLLLKKLSYCSESMDYKLFGVVDYEFDIRFIKFKMAYLKWWTYCEKNYVIAPKVCTISFSELLITNLISDLSNSK
jgi:hypothetical protein